MNKTLLASVTSSLLLALLLGTTSCGVKVSSSSTVYSSSSVSTTPLPTVGTALPSSVYSLGVTKLEGGSMDLSHYEGDVCLIVNVASECGYTKQYAGLQKLHEDYRDHGFSVLGFPSNEFGGQEPGSAEEIRTFCDTNYSITFPMFEKIETKEGDNQSSVYDVLGRVTGELPSWNFGKYLVSKEGVPLAYFASDVAPDSPVLREVIEKAIAQ